jgi:cysteine desulfurase/selenocysteine lyase
MSLNINKIRKDFPILQKKINRKPVIYFDNACISLKPIQVIRAMDDYYLNYTGCHGRSAHRFGRQTTQLYNKTRENIREFINASKDEEVIFTKNTTEAVNLVARSLGLKDGDIVLLSEIEHNSNLIIWQLLKREKGVEYKIIRLNDDLTFDLKNFNLSLTEKVKLVSLTHTSNISGVTFPAKQIIELAHKFNALVMLDGTQSAPHRRIDVQDLDVDFFVFSIHKMLGPTGVGVLYGKEKLLENMSQFIVGGETLIDSTYESYTPAPLPEKFEAGLQNYAGVIGASKAVEYIKNLGPENILLHENKLNAIITEGLLKIPEVTILGPRDPDLRGSIINFYVGGINSLDLAMVLDESSNIMVRSGKHCAHAWYNSHNIDGSVRASLYFYNTEEEAEIFVENARKAVNFLVK